MMASDDHHRHHAVLFPFMSKGHTIPVLHLARLLVSREVTVTLFTTPANQPFISNYLSDLSTKVTFSILALPFPEDIGEGVPPGTESTDKLPEISLWVPFARATHLMKPSFEKSLEALPGPPVTFMVSDGFLPWTLDSANKYGVPRLYYYGMGHFAGAVCRDVSKDGVIHQVDSDDEPFPVPHFPWIKVTRKDFDPPFTDRKPGSPHFEFVWECIKSAFNSFGQIVNSFSELDSAYADFNSRTWSVGPLCVFEPPRVSGGDHLESPPWIQWLDGVLEKGKPVLYVAFGSQAEMSPEQFREIKIGLEKSEVNFLWVVRKNGSELDDGFEERVQNRGLVVRDWVDQREILGHGSVQGFLSHCGWNSVLESICAKVPILAWPMMADQPLNARFVAEEIKIGIRVETRDGSVRGFVTAEGLEKSVKELMEGEVGKEARKKVSEVGEAAMKAVQEGGSSFKAVDELLNELQLHATAKSP